MSLISASNITPTVAAKTDAIQQCVGINIGHAEQASEEAEVICGGHRLVEVAQLETDTDMCMQLLSMSGNIFPQELSPPLFGQELPGQHLHRRRFTGAIWPQEAKDLALSDFEANVIDGE